MTFYVYEHVRNDTGMPFYVGNGKSYRLRVKQHRNPHWWAIVNKAGYSARIVAQTEDEDLALLTEQELIDKYRRNGFRLTNMTDGGEGMCGYRWDAENLKRRADKQRGQSRPTVSEKLKGRPKSEEHRRKLAEKKIGTKASATTRARMSETRKALGLKTLTCDRCGVTVNVLLAGRYHFAKCKKGN